MTTAQLSSAPAAGVGTGGVARNQIILYSPFALRKQAGPTQSTNRKWFQLGSQRTIQGILRSNLENLQHQLRKT